MHCDHKIFIQAIKNKKKVLVQHRDDTGRDTCTKVCRPLFYIPANDQTGCAHYYFWDGEKNERGNIIRIATEQIVHIGLTQEPFESAGFTLVNDEEISQRDSQPFDSSEHSQ
jgi:hypothetical protein